MNILTVLGKNNTNTTSNIIEVMLTHTRHVAAVHKYDGKGQMPRSELYYWNSATYNPTRGR